MDTRQQKLILTENEVLFVLYNWCYIVKYNWNVIDYIYDAVLYNILYRFFIFPINIQFTRNWPEWIKKKKNINELFLFWDWEYVITILQEYNEEIQNLTHWNRNINSWDWYFRAKKIAISFLKTIYTLQNTEFINTIWEFKFYTKQHQTNVFNYFNSFLAADEWREKTLIVWDSVFNITVEQADEISDEALDALELNFLKKQKWFEEIKSLEKLKKILNYRPVGWQRFFLMFQKRENYIVCCRQAGKSFTASYLALRQIMWHHQDVIYVVPDLNVAEQPFSYMERFARDIWDVWFKFDRARKIVSYARTHSFIYFVSANSKMLWRGRKANLLIFDEASFIDDVVYKTILPIIATTNGTVVALSTPSPITPINWFYFNFKKADSNADEMFSLRIDVDLNPFWSQEMKTKMKEEYEKDWVLSMTELYAMFPNVMYIPNINNFFIEVKKQEIYKYWLSTLFFVWSYSEILEGYNTLIIWYDPWIVGKWWFVLLWKKWDDVYIIWTWYLLDNSFEKQIWCIKQIYESLEKTPTIVVDATWVWRWILELFNTIWLPVTYRIIWGWTQWRVQYKDWFWHVPKNEMISYFIADVGKKVFSFSFMKELRSELEWYWLSKQKDGWHFDIFSALIMAYFVYKRIYSAGPRVIKKMQEIPEVWYDNFFVINSPQKWSERFQKFIY